MLAEELEERFLARCPLRAETVEYVRECLTAIRRTGRSLPFDPDVTASEGIDAHAGLRKRGVLATTSVVVTPQEALVIVGAPRSGTSHLVNLLAWQRLWAYLTTASCWAWPVYNLTRPRRRLFTELDGEVFAVDNRRTRVIPGLIMPGEAEDVYARAFPVYRHLRGHLYDIRSPTAGNPDILRRAVSSHLATFGSALLLTKSPFNAFRIRELESLWGGALRYLHVLRDRDAAAASMRRNGFEFHHRGRTLSAELAWELFTASIEEHAPADRLLTVHHADLVRDAYGVLAQVLAWVGVSDAPAYPGEASRRGSDRGGSAG